MPCSEKKYPIYFPFIFGNGVPIFTILGRIFFNYSRQVPSLCISWSNSPKNLDCHTVNEDRKNKYQVPLFSDHSVVADMQLENAVMAC